MGGELRPEGKLDVSSIELVGGALCLDFANTVEGREGPKRRDVIGGIGDLVQWAQRAEALSREEAQAILGTPAQSSEQIAALLRLRECVYRGFTAIARGREPAFQDLEELRESYGEAVRHGRLRPGELRMWEWEWGASGDSASVELIRWRVAHSAIELLGSGLLDRLKQCPGGGDTPCNWLFVDTTRSGNRRWCSMADCGGRAKWRRQNARRRNRLRD